jgi:osmotically-inducible protein OsmY
MVTDMELQRNVQAELLWEPRINAAEIGVSVKNGIVTLTGTVSSYGERREAEDAAKGVYGVSAVANDIQVRLPVESMRTDADIAQAAANALIWDVAVRDKWIKVTVSDGWVTLTGQVGWQHQRDAAERAVRNLTGVRGVVNEITVTPAATATGIQTRIEDALQRNAEVDAGCILVEVEDHHRV